MGKKETMLNEKAMRYIQRQINEISGSWDWKKNPETVEEILCAIYKKGFPEQSELQVREAAKKVMTGVKEYRQAYEKAVEDPEQWAKRFLQQQIQDKNEDERVASIYLQYVIQDTICRKAAGKLDTEEENPLMDLIEQLENEKFSVEDEGEDLTEDVLAEFKELYQSCIVIFKNLENTIKNLEQRLGADGNCGVAALSPEQIKNEYAIAAMVGYVGCKTGNIEGAFGEISLKQITLQVCAGMDAAGILTRYQAKQINRTTAQKLFKMIGVILCNLLSKGLIGARNAVGCILLGGVAGLVCGIGMAAYIILGARYVIREAGEVVGISFEKLKQGAREFSDHMEQKIVYFNKKITEKWDTVDGIIEKLKRKDKIKTNC